MVYSVPYKDPGRFIRSVKRDSQKTLLLHPRVNSFYRCARVAFSSFDPNELLRQGSPTHVTVRVCPECAGCTVGSGAWGVVNRG